MNRPPPYMVIFRAAHGGTGKTSLSAHVALGLARSGRTVTLVEECIPGLARHYLERPERGFSAPAAGDHPARQVAPNLFYLPTEALHTAALHRLEDSMGPRNSWIVVDTACDRQQRFDAESALELNVLRADPASLVDDPTLVSDDTRFVLNQIDHRRPLSRDIDHVLGTLLGERIIARVHYDEALPESLASHSNVFDTAPASRAAAALTDLVDYVISVEESTTPIVASRSAD